MTKEKCLARQKRANEERLSQVNRQEAEKERGTEAGIRKEEGSEEESKKSEGE